MTIVALTKRSIYFILGWLIIAFLIIDTFEDIHMYAIIFSIVVFLIIIGLNIRGIIGRLKFEDEMFMIDADHRLDEEEQLQKAYKIAYKDIQYVEIKSYDPIINTNNQPLVRGLRSDQLHRIKYGREPYQALVFKLTNHQEAKLILNAFSKKQQDMIFNFLSSKGVTIPLREEVKDVKSPYVFRNLWDLFTYFFIFVFLVQIIHARIFGGNAIPIPEDLFIQNPDGYYLISQGIATEVSYPVWLTNYVLIWVSFLLLMVDTILGISHLIQKHILKKSKLKED